MSDEQSMVERVARAIAKENGYAASDRYVHGGPMWRQFVGQARAAIEAMREPTEDMQKAGFRLNKWTNPKPCHDHCVGRVTMPVDAPWRAMIDAALKEGS